MYSLIFDTETCSLQKPFCYDVGYVIMDNDSGEIVIKKHFVVEQIWHNNELFSTAYYAEKREKYVALMRTRKAIMSKFGYITQEMIKKIVLKIAKKHAIKINSDKLDSLVYAIKTAINSGAYNQFSGLVDKYNEYAFDEVLPRSYELGIYSLYSYRTTDIKFHKEHSLVDERP